MLTATTRFQNKKINERLGRGVRGKKKHARTCKSGFRVGATDAPRRLRGRMVRICRVGPLEAPSASQSDETQMNGATSTMRMCVCARNSDRVCSQPEVRGPLGDPIQHCKRQTEDRAHGSF